MSKLGREPKLSPSHTRGVLADEVKLLWEVSNEMIVDACCAIDTESSSLTVLVASRTVPSSWTDSVVFPNVGTPSNTFFSGTSPTDTAEEKIPLVH